MHIQKYHNHHSSLMYDTFFVIKSKYNQYVMHILDTIRIEYEWKHNHDRIYTKYESIITTKYI